MTRKSHFTSQRTALFLGLGFISASLFAWITYAQLNIPTGLSNAMITIQKIMLSTNGTSISENASESTIFLDGINGNITTKWPGTFPNNPWGNLTVGWEVRLKHTDFVNGTGCNTLTWCVLKVTTDGKVQVTNNVNPWIGNEDEQTSVFKRTNGDPLNIFLATNTGNESIAGIQNNQQYLRIWAIIGTGIRPEQPDTAIVAWGIFEARWLLIRKINNDNLLWNQWDNQRTKITSNYTDIHIIPKQNNSIEIKTSATDALNATKDTSVVFSNKAANKKAKVGINFNPASSNTIQRTPSADLHVGQGWVFMVWWRPGAPSFCDDSGTCTADVGTNTLMVDSNTQQVGIWLSNPTGPQKTLDVNGDVAVSTTLTVGHASTFDPGSDKLAVNGSTRANAYYYNSDSRYKSNIETLQSPLKKLLEITWYTYFNKLSNKKDIWVIAQEIESVYPELVQTDADGYKSVQYGNLVAPIIEAIKELASKIDSLFTLYVSQQAKIDTLEARLQVLEAKVK